MKLKALIVAFVLLASLFGIGLNTTQRVFADTDWEAHYWNEDEEVVWSGPSIPETEPDYQTTYADLALWWEEGQSPNEAIDDDFFIGRFTKTIDIAETSYYHLNLEDVDDGARLYIDDELIVDEWVIVGEPQDYSHSRLMEAGTYQITIEFFEYMNTAGLTFSLEEDIAGLFEGGAGTVENPYQISTCSQLQAISTNSTTLAADYVLEQNVDCSMEDAPLVFQEDFEGTVSDWSTSGTNSSWHVADETCALEYDTSNSHFDFNSKMYGTNGNAGSDCTQDNNETSLLMSPIIALPESSNLYLNLKSWALDEGGRCGSSGYDAKSIQITTDGGDTTTILNDCYALNGTAVHEELYFDISDFAGQDIQLIFNYMTDDDCCAFELGWFIDDVTVGVGKLFTPIGNEESLFYGSFDGNGYSISGVTIGHNPQHEYAGMFSAASQGSVIRNLTLSDSIISDHQHATGGLVGYSEGQLVDIEIGDDVFVYGGSDVGGMVGRLLGTSQDSTSGGFVKGIESVGGLVGKYQALDEDADTINDSHSSAQVTGGSIVGGLVGTNDANIYESSASGTVIGTYTEVGGLVGRDEGEIDPDDESCSQLTTIVDSFSTGNVRAEQEVGGLIGYSHCSLLDGVYSTSDVHGDGEIGGLIGQAYASSIVGSYAEGDVTARYSENLDEIWSSEVGGLVGYAVGVEIAGSYATGDVSGTDEVGGLIGYASIYEINDSDYAQTIVSDSYASGDVSGNDEIGGLVGDLNGGIITRSFATGNITGLTANEEQFEYNEELDEDISIGLQEVPSASLGGLVGQSDNDSFEVDDDEEIVVYSGIYESYATGNVIGSEKVGGLVGENEEQNNIEDSYARGRVTGTGSEQQQIGSAVGENLGYIYNIYATGNVTASGDQIGGLIGVNHDDDIEGEVLNSFWDKQTTSKVSSAGGTGKTTAEMKNTLTYTSLATAGLDEAWDFMSDPNDDSNDSDIWSINAGNNNGYPCLTWQEEAELCINLPDNGDDLNGDGIPDSQQGNIKSMSNPITGQIAVLEVDPNCSVVSLAINAENTHVVQDSGFDYPHGFMNFSVDCGDAHGYTTSVKQYYYNVSPSNITVRKFNPNTNAYLSLTAYYSATTHARVIYAQPVLVAVYNVTDGGTLDIDNVANGKIIDPAGLGVLSVGSPNTGFGRGN